MKGARGYFLLAGLGLILLVNAIVLAGVAWNRQQPAESRLQLYERELTAHYDYRKENSGIGLRLLYRWPSAEAGEGDYPGIALEKMAELGFWVPGELDDDSVRRYRRQLQRDALLVLELDGAAYRREVQLVKAASIEAQRLLQLAPENRQLKEAARKARMRLAREQHRASRLLVVDVGLDRQALRTSYPDSQRYAIVRGLVRPYANHHMLAWDGEGEDLRTSQQRRQWRLGGSAKSPGMDRIHLPQRWHGLFATLPRRDAQVVTQGMRGDKLFSVELAFGRRLEPWIADLQGRTP